MLKSKELLFEQEEFNMKEKMSPFKTIKGEKLVFIDESLTAHNLWITEQQSNILKLVNQYMWMSSKLLISLLNENDPESIKKDLRHLSANGYLRKAYFAVDDRSKSSGRAYCISDRGKFELRREGFKVNRYAELNSHNAEIVKEVLSGNQAMLMTYGVNASYFVRKPIFTTSHFFKQCFRVAGYFLKDGEQFLFNSVRTHCRDEVEEKLTRMHKTLRHKNNITSSRLTTTIVFVCDSKEHMEWVKSIVEQSKLKKVRELKIAFTYDALTNMQRIAA